jgi:hypothetical protein
MARVARVHGGKGNVLTRRERGREKGHGVILTTPRSYDDGLWWEIGGAGVELQRRGARSMVALSSGRAAARQRAAWGKTGKGRGG